jgi:site-specific DNA recombinase
MDKIKVAAYCRVSTNSDDQKHSFEAQKKFFEEKAKESETYEITKIYADQGTTGVYLKKRKEFLNMVYDAGIDYDVTDTGYSFKWKTKRKPKFEKILIKDISRFSRNMDTVALIRALKNKGVSLVLVNQGLEIATDRDEFYLNMLLNFAQQESVDRGDKVRFGLKQSAKNGVIKFSRDLYGYNYNPETKEIKIVEEEAEVVRLIFDLYINKDMGVRRIMQHLEKRGIKTRQGKNFGYSTLTRMIDNRKYCGDLVYFKYDSGTVLNKHTSHKVRPEKDWIIHEDVIPAIISRDIFEKAKELKSGRADVVGKFKGRKHKITTYSNKIICGNCGGAYGRNRANDMYFYNCMTKKKLGTGKCDYPNFKEHELDEHMDRLAKDGLKKYFLFKKNTLIEKLESIIEQLVNKMSEEIPEEYYLKKEEISKIEGQKEKLLNLYLDGTFSKEMLDKKVAELEQSKAKLEDEILKLSLPVNEIQKQKESLENRISELKKLRINKVQSKEELLDLVDNITVEHTFDSLTFTVQFKLQETLNKSLSTLDINPKDFNEIKPPQHIFTIKTSRNTPARLPKNGDLYQLKEDVDPDEFWDKVRRDAKSRAEEFERLSGK